MTFRIAAAVAPHGDGIAHRNYPTLIRAAVKYFPEIEGCGLHGTINLVNLHPPLAKIRADCWTPRFAWGPFLGKDGGVIAETWHEAYGFIRCKFQCPVDGPLYPAWIVFPERHAASYQDALGPVEVLAREKIPEVKPGIQCVLWFDHIPAQRRPESFGRRFPCVADSAAIPNPRHGSVLTRFRYWRDRRVY